MNKEIQPEFKEVTVTCACGTVYTTHSAKGDMKVDICSNCHPYWSGNAKSTTRGGRADKFKEKYRELKGILGSKDENIFLIDMDIKIRKKRGLKNAQTG